jgi:predicted component of type VI protein secretion system
MGFFRCENTIRKTRKDVPVRKMLTTIGRAAGNDIVLDDPVVQPTHANLMRQGAQHTLSLVDRNGELYVNGKRTRTAQLQEGDRVLLGAFQLTWHEGEPQTSSASQGEGLSLEALSAVVDLSAAMLRDTTPERLFAVMLEKLVELTGAEKGFVVVMQDGERHLAASHTSARRSSTSRR